MSLILLVPHTCMCGFGSMPIAILRLCYFGRVRLKMVDLRPGKSNEAPLVQEIFDGWQKLGLKITLIEEIGVHNEQHL